MGREGRKKRAGRAVQRFEILRIPAAVRDPIAF
jgi:hypothetical protein